MNQPHQVASSAAPPAAANEYRIRSTAPIPPGLEAPIPYRLPQACSVTDIVAPEGFHIARVAFGKRSLDLADGELVADHLKGEPYKSDAQSFVLVRVRNDSSEPRIAEIAIRVIDEHGPVGGPAVFGPARFQTGAYASAPTAADGSPMPTEPMPREPTPPEPPMPKERITSGFRANSVKQEPKAAPPAAAATPAPASPATETQDAQNEKVKRARRPQPPPIPSPTAARKAKQGRVGWRDKRREEWKANEAAARVEEWKAKEAATRAEASVTAAAAATASESSAGPDESPVDHAGLAEYPGEVAAVGLFHAYATALLQALEAGQPMSKGVRNPVAMAFEAGAESDVQVPAGRNQVAILIPRELAIAFGAAVRSYQEVTHEGAAYVRAALQQAYAPDATREAAEVTPAPPSPVAPPRGAEVAAAAAPAASAPTPTPARTQKTTTPESASASSADAAEHVPPAHSAPAPSAPTQTSAAPAMKPAPASDRQRSTSFATVLPLTPRLPSDGRSANNDGEEHVP